MRQGYRKVSSCLQTACRRRAMSIYVLYPKKKKYSDLDRSLTRTSCFALRALKRNTLLEFIARLIIRYWPSRLWTSSESSVTPHFVTVTVLNEEFFVWTKLEAHHVQAKIDRDTYHPWATSHPRRRAIFWSSCYSGNDDKRAHKIKTRKETEQTPSLKVGKKVQQNSEIKKASSRGFNFHFAAV